MNTQPETPLAVPHSPLHNFDFTRDWLVADTFVRDFLPSSDDLMKERLTALAHGAWQPWSADEIEEVRAFNTSVKNHAGAGLVDALGKDDALVVVTGQQPDFLASPLYVLHKALSACAWAKRVAAEVRRPVVPVFWVASDDDDFAELKRAFLTSFEGEMVDAGSRISRGNNLPAGTPAYFWDTSDSAERSMADIRRALANWPGGETTTNWLKAAMDDHSNFETFFCFLLQSLLGNDYPMLFVAPRLQVFRRRQSEVLSADLARHRKLNLSISRAAEEFRAAGYPVTLERDANAPNFFWLNENRRHRLLRRGQEIVAFDPHTHKESAQFSEADLLAQLKSFPQNFAPNVVTRPVVQDVSLPTIAYVAGPGELAYLAVLGEAYRQLDCVRSAVILRCIATMELANTSAKSGEVSPPHQQVDTILSQKGQEGTILLCQLGQLMTDASKNINAMRASSATLRPEVHTALDKTERHFLRGIEQLKRRLARQVARQQWNQAARRATLTAPPPGPQERTLSPWNFVKAGEWDALARYLASQIDYTATTPQTAPFPPWMDEVI